MRQIKKIIREQELTVTCTDCGKSCTPKEDCYDYPATHCNYGRAGSEPTGEYVSDCCNSEIEVKDND